MRVSDELTLDSDDPRVEYSTEIPLLNKARLLSPHVAILSLIRLETTSHLETQYSMLFENTYETVTIFPSYRSAICFLLNSGYVAKISKKHLTLFGILASYKALKR